MVKLLQANSTLGRNSHSLCAYVVLRGDPGPKNGKQRTAAGTGTGKGTATRTETRIEAETKTVTGGGAGTETGTGMERGQPENPPYLDCEV